VPPEEAAIASRVFFVGLLPPGNVGEHVSLGSDTSLFDADIVVFRPSLAEYHSYESYAGERLLSESDSADVHKELSHWRTELKAAVDGGKLVLVLLTQPQVAYYYTGAREHSGTGRSRVTTNIVAPVSSYDAVPFKFAGLVPRGGGEIAVLNPLGPIAAYWNEFGKDTRYEVYFDPDGLKPLLGTKNREKVVGGVIRTKAGGALVLLPPVFWDEDALSYTRGKKQYWRKSAVALGSRFVTALVAAHSAYRKQGERTPPPAWSSHPTFAIPAEQEVIRKIEGIDAQIASLTARRKTLEADLEDAGTLRALLYETGKPLETAIILALKLLGFEANPYKDGESEFDAVFTSSEGRFLGEAEGKDNKAVNIDKLSQLERNLQEDFAKDGVTEYAKGVLFGNAFRLQPPGERQAFFTDKCLTAAKRLHAALVRTPDLFAPALYLSTRPDSTYAEACRRAIYDTDGAVVEFPSQPAAETGGT
jgi:hypothetical protein